MLLDVNWKFVDSRFVRSLDSESCAGEELPWTAPRSSSVLAIGRMKKSNEGSHEETLMRGKGGRSSGYRRMDVPMLLAFLPSLITLIQGLTGPGSLACAPGVGALESRQS